MIRVGWLRVKNSQALKFLSANFLREAFVAAIAKAHDQHLATLLDILQQASTSDLWLEMEAPNQIGKQASILVHLDSFKSSSR